MVQPKTGALAFALALSTAGCGGSSQPAEPPAPFPTPAVHELARLQSEGGLDQARLACASAALASMMDELAPVLPVLWSASQPRWTTPVPSNHARSVQDGMASSDRSAAAMRRASEARATARYATETGNAMLATQASNWAIWAMRQADDPSQPSRGRAVWRPPTRWTVDDTRLLEEYATLFAQAMTPADEESDVDRSRLAELGTEAPQVMEAYAGLLLTAYEDPELECLGGSRP